MVRAMVDPLSSQALAQAFRQHGPLILRRAMRLLGNRADAEEAMQEVFFLALRGNAPWDGSGELLAWLYRITTNHCLGIMRKRGRRRDLLDEHYVPAGTQSASPQDLLMLRWLLANADPREAQAAVYVYLDGMSYAQAAAPLKVSKRTVGNLLARFEKWARAQVENLPAQEAS